MLNFIVNDRNKLAQLIKQAQKETNSLKPSQVFEMFIKIAQNEKYDDFSNLDYDLNEMFKNDNFSESERRNILDEMYLNQTDKVKQIQKYLKKINENFALIYTYAKSKIQPNSKYAESLEDGLSNMFLYEKNDKKNLRNIYRYILQPLFSGEGANVKKAINSIWGSIMQEAQNVTIPSNVDKDEFISSRTESDKIQEQKNKQTYEISGDIEDKINAVSNIFNKFTSNPENFLMSYYINPQLPKGMEEEGLESLMQKHLRLKSAIENANSDEESLQAQADYDEFYKYITDEFIPKRMGPTRYTPGNITSEFTKLDLEKEVNEYLEKINIENLVEDILQSNFYTLPKWAREYATADEQKKYLIKEIMISLIKSEAILGFKRKMNVALTRSYGKFVGTGKSQKLAQINILIHSLQVSIKKIIQDPEEQQELLERALNIIFKKTTISEEDLKKDLRYTLFQHVTPMIISGLRTRAEKKYNKSFQDLNNQEKEQVVEEILSTVYPVFPYTDTTPAKYISKNFDELEDSNIPKEQLRKLFGVENDEKNIAESSILNTLIKKYAFKN